MKGGPKPLGGPTDCARAHPPARAAATATPPITRIFFFMFLSNPLQRDRLVRCAYWEGKISLKFFRPALICDKVCQGRPW
jgi:hypothetical protein